MISLPTKRKLTRIFLVSAKMKHIFTGNSFLFSIFFVFIFNHLFYSPARTRQRFYLPSATFGTQAVPARVFPSPTSGTLLRNTRSLTHSLTHSRESKLTKNYRGDTTRPARLTTRCTCLPLPRNLLRGGRLTRFSRGVSPAQRATSFESRLGEREGREGREGGGGGGSFFAYLSHLTIDHASLSRRGAPFLLPISTPPTFGRSVRFFRIFHKIICFSNLI